MKRIWHHPEEAETGKRYWRSMGELENSPEFAAWMEREFPEGADSLELDGVSRRSFVKLMGASAALAGIGLAGCRRPESYLVPYAKNVEWSIPGKPLLYTTAMPRLDGCTPLVATTFEGRPTLLTGNPNHPSNQLQVEGEAKGNSGTDSFAQASILSLYDPERSRDFLKGGNKATRREFYGFFDELKGRIAETNGQGVAVIVGESSSPTLDRLLGDLQTRFPELQYFRYEPFNRDNVRSGLSAYFGRNDIRILPRLDKATRILSLDCDFLGMDRVGGNPGHGFSVKRRPETLEGVTEDSEGNISYEWRPRTADEMNRLYVVEPAFTVTGGVADHRLRLSSSQILTFAIALAQELGVEGVQGTPTLSDSAMLWVKETAADLMAAQGTSLVLAGSLQSPDLHRLTAAINEKLGAFGETIELLSQSERDFGSLGDLREAIATEGDAQIKIVISLTEADPAYDAPNDYRWPEVMEDVEYIQLAYQQGATAHHADWHIPGTHFLESWSDVRAADGTYSVVQPMVEPLFGGWSAIDLILNLLDSESLVAQLDQPVEDDGVPIAEKPAEEPSASYRAVRDTFANTLGIDFENGEAVAWNHCLRDGFLPGSGFPAANASAGSLSFETQPLPEPTLESLEVRFVWDSKVYDGRYINNSWLQEAPDPITKLTWDNAAVVSVATFRALGLRKDGQRIKLKFNGREGYFPVLQVPGHADNCITIPVGYGQRYCGHVGYGTGFDVYRMRTSATPYFVQGAQLEIVESDLEIDASLPEANRAPNSHGVVKIAAWEEPALTQEHSSMEGRAIVRDGTLSEFEKDREFSKFRGMDSHIPPNINLYKPVNTHGVRFDELDPNHQWAMTIDLNSCLGCSACMIACQAENNIPVVGKDQVLRGREMHWIRMDRYFADPSLVLEDKPDEHQETDVSTRGVEIVNEDAIEMLPQPVACQHCENAPCETVCPVNATVHSSDGLNAMAYNRCIGTRYCANNCPYKVRRFNYFDYNKRNPLVRKNVGPLEFNNLYAGPVGERHDEPIKALQKNPNVTVRMRGVIEKCTYCVQRIETAKIAQKVKARDSDRVQVPANTVKTACQQACSLGAIEFGNLKSAGDTVNAYKASPRSYDLLKYVNTKPRTSYLARIKNPNTAMPYGTEVGTSTKYLH